MVLLFIEPNCCKRATEIHDMVTFSPTIKLSFEFFPPKTEEMEQKLWHAVKVLEPLKPDFVSVTYGAGGTTRERTHRLVERILKETTLKPAAHLTCVGASRDEVHEIVRHYMAIGVRHIVALRGDAPKDAPNFTAHPEGYHYANELVEGLSALGRAEGGLELSVSAYPEKHPESPSLMFDIELLKKKMDAGAARAITQYFFDTEHFTRYRDLATKAGITIPIVPGILPIHTFAQTVKFSAMCGASVPDWVHHRFAGSENSTEDQQKIGIALATELCEKLKSEGVNQFHFYTLNRAELTKAVVESF
jgi:methylenetetrahydrofolate reductase (NADPH)